MKQIFPILILRSKTEQNVNNSEESASGFFLRGEFRTECLKEHLLLSKFVATQEMKS